MTVQDLIDELEGFDLEAEVRFLAQPSWPFEYTIAAVVEATDQPPDLSGTGTRLSRACCSSRAGRPATPIRGTSGRTERPMPDRHGFNLLGDSVRCIDCETGGPIWHWPERKRRRHAHRHRAAARPARTTELRRRRTLLAAPPARNDEEKKEVPTMAKRRATTGEPAKQVAIDVLREAGEPLHAKEIAKRVLDSGRARLSGKTPEQTITAMLAVGSKPGGPFTRVDKGTYALAEAAAAPAEDGPAADKPESKPRQRKRQKQTPTA